MALEVSLFCFLCPLVLPASSLACVCEVCIFISTSSRSRSCHYVLSLFCVLPLSFLWGFCFRSQRPCVPFYHRFFLASMLFLVTRVIVLQRWISFFVRVIYPGLYTSLYFYVCICATGRFLSNRVYMTLPPLCFFFASV